ncbi:ATP-binding cassette domain-containing protein [Streptomyces sp. NPDC005969]|uniref:ATP-binding cassette domain-containing protein n=1 Tax=Streptomyces sp. NPDC005969 TaxID=3156722 RepID=UPI0033F5B183
MTAAVGENGSGMKTLPEVLSGLLLPHSGTVRWGARELSDLDRAEVFSRASLLTQDFQRWPMTAALNIRIGRPGQDAQHEDLEPSVDYARVSPIIAKLPHGMRSLLARMCRGAIELSGGEWQKFGLARNDAAQRAQRTAS